MKILLLNPPAADLYLRDMYSSTRSKWGYSWPPADLLVLSGILRDRFDIQFLDANILKLSPDETIARIDPETEVAIFLTGSSSIKNDIGFMEALKRSLPGLRTIGIGGCLIHEPKRFLERFAVLDAVLLNFVTDDVVSYIRGEVPSANLVYRGPDGKAVATPERLPGKLVFGIPRHDLLPLDRYRLPYGRYSPVTSVVASYGCPYRCRYCVACNVKYVERDTDDLIAELRMVRDRGVGELIFRDNTFGVNRTATIDLCRRIAGEKLDLSWACDSRVNVMGYADLLEAMKAAGCHTIHFGIESGDPKTLLRYGKGVTHEEIKRTFRLCKAAGIKTMGYFIIGLPGEDRESVERTIAFAKELDCDFASFNIPIPIYGTPLREEAIANRWIEETLDVFDGSYFPVISTPTLSADEVWRLRQRAIREFYLRPRFIAKKLFGLRSIRDAEQLVKNFLNFIHF